MTINIGDWSFEGKFSYTSKLQCKSVVCIILDRTDAHALLTKRCTYRPIVWGLPSCIASVPLRLGEL